MKINKQYLAAFLIGAIVGGVTIGVIDTKKPQPLFSSANDAIPRACVHLYNILEDLVVQIEAAQPSERESLIQTYETKVGEFIDCIITICEPIVLQHRAAEGLEENLLFQYEQSLVEIRNLVEEISLLNDIAAELARQINVWGGRLNSPEYRQLLEEWRQAEDEYQDARNRLPDLEERSEGLNSDHDRAVEQLNAIIETMENMYCDEDSLDGIELPQYDIDGGPGPGSGIGSGSY